MATRFMRWQFAAFVFVFTLGVPAILRWCGVGKAEALRGLKPAVLLLRVMNSAIVL
jgi:hypothetical protein